MKKWGIAVLVGAALGLGALAQPGSVELVPAAEEVEALRAAWANVLTVFEASLVEFKGAVEKLNSNDQDLLNKYRALAVQLKDLEAKLLQVQETWAEKIPALENSLSECFVQVRALHRGLEEAVAGYQAADAALEEKIVALGVSLDQLDSRVKILESSDIGSLSRRMLSLEQAIQGVQIKIENNRAKVGALEKTLGGFAADISALKESVQGLEAKSLEHESRIATVEDTFATNVQDLTARLDTVQVLSILGLLAGAGAILLVLLGGMGG